MEPQSVTPPEDSGGDVEPKKERPTRVSRVETLLESLDIAENQVTSSADKAIKDIHATFDALSVALQKAIKQRKATLTADVERARNEGMNVLRPCRTALASGTNSIRIPRSEEVAHITAQLPNSSLTVRLCAEIEAAGRVSRQGPVQIAETEEKPGGLLLRWEEIDPERSLDMGEFRLQQAVAVHNKEPSYYDIYRGPEQSFVARQLMTGQPYTFRVCCRAEGEQEWSAWSLPRISQTNQKPYGWDFNCGDYEVSVDGKIGTKMTAEPALLFSRGPQYGPGHSVQFTIMEAQETLSDEGVGLAIRRLKVDSLLQPGVFFLSSQGRVLVDGVEKTTRLPGLVRGSVVSFTCERIRDDRVRVHIDSHNKTVSYDWRVPIKRGNFYFVLGFGQVGWKVLVN